VIRDPVQKMILTRVSKNCLQSAIQDLTVGVVKDNMLRQLRHLSHTPHTHMQPDPGPQFYKPGDTVPASGIYAVGHAEEHRGLQEVVLMVNHVFPQCEICEDAVRYRLVRAAPYVLDDSDFKDA